MIKISPSILSSNNRIDSITKINQTTAEYIHIDAMDGKFVKNIQMPIEEIIQLEKISKKPLDIHLMVEKPLNYIEKLKNKNIEYITFHLEIDQDIKKIINQIKSLNYKVGIAIKPKTNIEELLPYINEIDLILIMSVEPGYGGQEFIPNSIIKAKNIKNIKNNITIEMDGGIKNTNINYIKDYVDIAVVGSYITNSKDYKLAIKNLKI